MKRITYTSKPELFSSSVKIRIDMDSTDRSHVLARFELSDDADTQELVVHYKADKNWRVMICNTDIIYGFHGCAFDGYEYFQAANRGTPF